MADYASLIEKQKAELEAQLAKLSKVDITSLEQKKSKLFAEIDEIDRQIAEVLTAAGISTKASKGGKTKKQGIQVSYARLLELFKEHKTTEISTRKLGLDPKQVKKLVDENSDKLKYIAGAWPVVELKKK